MKVYEFLRILLMHNLLNQKKVAQQLEMSVPAFCDLLKGKRRITRINAKLFEEYFNVPAMVLQFWQLYDDQLSPPADQEGMVTRERKRAKRQTTKRNESDAKAEEEYLCEK